MNPATIAQFLIVLFLSEIIATSMAAIFFSSFLTESKTKPKYQPSTAKQKPHIVIILADDLVNFFLILLLLRIVFILHLYSCKNFYRMKNIMLKFKFVCNETGLERRKLSRVGSNPHAQHRRPCIQWYHLK